MIVQSDDRILIGGQFSAPTNSIARLEADGRPDVGFDQTFTTSVGATLDGYIEKLAVQSNGEIVVSGWFSRPKPWVLRLGAKGALDERFAASPESALDAAVLCVLIDSKGRLVLGGAFTTPSGHLTRTD